LKLLLKSGYLDFQHILVPDDSGQSLLNQHLSFGARVELVSKIVELAFQSINPDPSNATSDQPGREAADHDQQNGQHGLGLYYRPFLLEDLDQVHIASPCSLALALYQATTGLANNVARPLAFLAGQRPITSMPLTNSESRQMPA
jgi:hypothetical protein